MKIKPFSRAFSLITLFTLSAAEAQIPKIERLQLVNPKIFTQNDAALSSKFELTNRAQKSLDLSYFIIEDDYTSSLLMEKILSKVAEARQEKRSLKVRILVDYFMSEKQLPLLRLLNDDPDIEVRRYGAPSADWRALMAKRKVDGPLFVSSLMAQNAAGLKKALSGSELVKDLGDLAKLFPENGEKKNPLESVVDLLGALENLKLGLSARDTLAFIRGLQDFLHRSHHKLLLVDGTCFQMGGRNLSDEYHAPMASPLIQGDEARKIAARSYPFADLDVAACLAPNDSAGSAILKKSFQTLWVDPKSVGLNFAFTDAERIEETLSPERISQIRIESQQSLSYKAAIATSEKLHLRPGKPLTAKETSLEAAYFENKNITETYIALLDSMEKGDEATFVNAYFYIDGNWKGEHKRLTDLYTSFLNAAKRGVKISVYTNSIVTTDLNMVNLFSYPTYRALAEAGIRLFELNARQGALQRRLSLHMKGGYVQKADGRLRLLVSSYNLDPRSHARDTNNALIVEIPQSESAKVRADFDLAFNRENQSKEIEALQWTEVTNSDLATQEAKLKALEALVEEPANKKTRMMLLPARIEI